MINWTYLISSFIVSVAAWSIVGSHKELAAEQAKNTLLEFEKDKLIKNNKELSDFIKNCIDKRRSAKMNSLDTQVLFIAAFRYALGRTDNSVPAMVDNIRWSRDLLTDQTAALMVREIKECKDLGAECDAEAWRGLLEFLSVDVERWMEMSFGDAQDDEKETPLWRKAVKRSS